MAGYNMALQFPGRAFLERFSRETAAERSAPLFDGAFSTPQTFLLQPDFSRDGYGDGWISGSAEEFAAKTLCGGRK